MNKKGISPLIATVLLIGFTVALAVFIMTWGFGFFEEYTKSVEETGGLSLKCSPSRLEFSVDIDCSDNGITVMNRGIEDIVKLRVISYPSTDFEDIEEELVSADIISKDNVFPSGTTKLEVVAYILFEGKETPCAAAAREITVDC